MVERSRYGPPQARFFLAFMHCSKEKCIDFRTPQALNFRDLRPPTHIDMTARGIDMTARRIDNIMTTRRIDMTERRIDMTGPGEWIRTRNFTPVRENLEFEK